MEHDIGLQNRHRAVGHFERGIILAVPVERIVLPKTDTDHVRYFENVLLAVKCLQVHRKLDCEAVCRIRGRSKLRVGILRGEAAHRGMRGIKKP